MTFLPRRNWLVFYVLLMACSGLHAQTVEGHFKLHKTDYLIDEPIFVTIEIANLGSQPIGILHTSPYGCISYGFHVKKPGINWQSCRSTAGSCPGSTRRIAPGEKFQEEILLQYWMRLDQPGVYEISASGRIHYINSFPDLTAPREKPLEVRANLTVSIHAPESAQQLQALYEPILENLNSKEEEKWTDAARIITEIAPAFLQPTILDMARDPMRQYFALSGLWKLNTPKSRAVLADWVCASRDTYSAIPEIAVRHLGEMGDRSYMPMLLRLAKESDNDYVGGQALNAFAELGGDEAVPELLRILKDQRTHPRYNVLWALARTGSKNAVPHLIQAIRVQGLTEMALSALQGLTRKRLAAPHNPATAYQKWSDWWKANESTARIYGPTECGESETID
jgi:hypothetical protein